MAEITLKKGEIKQLHLLSNKLNPQIDFFVKIKKIKGQAFFCQKDSFGNEDCCPLEETIYQAKGLLFSFKCDIDECVITYELKQLDEYIS